MLTGAIALVTFSCSKDDEDSIKQETEVSKTEVKTILETDEVSSAADDLVRELFENKESGKSAKDNSCYEATYTDTGFSIAFDNCSPEDNGEIYDGSLSVIYGKEGESFAYSIDFDNLKVGGIGLDGSRSFAFDTEQENSVVFEVTSDMTLTMPEDNVISEKGSKTFAIIFGEEFGQGKLTLDGDWTLKTDGNTYSIAIPNLLETDFGCEYISKGVMELNKNGLEVSIDFGDGSCDDMAELAYPDGTRENFSLKE